MRRITTIIAATLGAFALMAGPALARGESPVRFEEGVDHAHGHYVVTPHGCVDIHGPVYFAPGPGPHHAAFVSSGFAAVFFGGQDESLIDFTRGLWHDLGGPFPGSDELC